MSFHEFTVFDYDAVIEKAMNEGRMTSQMARYSLDNIFDDFFDHLNFDLVNKATPHENEDQIACGRAEIERQLQELGVINMSDNLCEYASPKVG